MLPVVVTLELDANVIKPKTLEVNRPSLANTLTTGLIRVLPV
jgi:hypothetical protein